MTRPAKHSLTLQGHRTSVSLEPEFWRAFTAIARARGQGINQLAVEIDGARAEGTGLATAIRLFVLADLQARLAAREEG
ncbi:MAG: ribbon-helix-helix domain-containing protein [Defluviimonas sp.]|nr:ribbon-helix-helix domain-containing protein [Defluviimonas sp.]